MPKNILIIDDDNLVARSLEKYLESRGYSVEVANNGNEALEKTEKSAFNLIISDIRMPGMNGVETLKRIREYSARYQKEGPPAIIITGYADDETYRQAEELGIVGCIQKPFDLDELIEIVNKNLEVPPLLKKISIKHELLDDKFVSLVEDIKQYMQDVKDKFDEFDMQNNNRQKQIDYIESNKQVIFENFDNYFNKIWDIVKYFGRDKYIAHQGYYQSTLGHLILDFSIVNRYIYQKPLGYAGDYMMMNYIYDYYGNNYLGDSSFERLINNYTCNIPISRSNIKRKEFLKEKIIETLERKKEARVLSVACGSARELIELLNEGKIIKPLLFSSIDFEKKALDYIDSEINKLDGVKKGFLSLRCICRDITSIIRDKKLKNELESQDLIYAFGIFDYLNERMASRMVKELFQLLSDHGKLIICNISSENSSHRGYYELFGEWNMIYRTKEEMLSLTKDINNIAEVNFEDYSFTTNYLFLTIKKV
jgi:CheY-like chemotaxis protein